LDLRPPTPDLFGIFATPAIVWVRILTFCQLAVAACLELNERFLSQGILCGVGRHHTTSSGRGAAVGPDVAEPLTIVALRQIVG
jgi:hypothetical protein